MVQAAPVGKSPPSMSHLGGRDCSGRKGAEL
jgi:hypothetical protein